MRRRTEGRAHDAWPVGEQVGLVLELEDGVFRIAAAAGLTSPPETDFEEVLSDRSTELLVERVRGPVHIPHLGAGRAEQPGH